MKNFIIYIVILFLLVSVGCISKPIPFNENEAYEMLKTQSKWIERYPNGKDAESCRQYIKEKLVCDKYIEQDFETVAEGKKLKLKNIIGIINPKAEKYILLSSHYDNRPMCDQDPVINNLEKPCPGANDGASSTALLLEMSKVLKSQKSKLGFVIVFFDGEDYGKDEDNMYLGSKYFAEHKSDIFSSEKVDYGILLDMIGDKDLNIYIEQMSNFTAPEIVEKVWGAAKKLGYNKYFIPKVKYAISDDHIPLIEKGIKCIDIIDFDYTYWHTKKDTADKCSQKSLKIVGETVLSALKDMEDLY